jgi:DNA-binding transcriptional ArsR family regulator
LSVNFPMAADPLHIIDEPSRVRSALQPVRLRLLHLLDTPQSAPQLAKAIGLPRQQVNYHLRELQAQHLVEAQEHGRVGRRIDRTFARTATSYVIAPKTLGGVPIDPRAVSDAFSSVYLSAVNTRALNDLAALRRAAAAKGKRVPTLTVESVVRFATLADQRRFGDELTAAFAALAAKYHRQDAPQGRSFRVFACGYPAVAAHPPGSDPVSPLPPNSSSDKGTP